MTLKRKSNALKKKGNSKKGYGSLDVRLSERFSMIEKLKKSYAVKRLCEVFGVHRSSYRYWANRDKPLSSEHVLARAEVRRSYELSNGSSGARTIADIVTARGIRLSQLPATKTYVQKSTAGTCSYT